MENRTVVSRDRLDAPLDLRIAEKELRGTEKGFTRLRNELTRCSGT